MCDGAFECVLGFRCYAAFGKGARELDEVVYGFCSQVSHVSITTMSYTPQTCLRNMCLSSLMLDGRKSIEFLSS